MKRSSLTRCFSPNTLALILLAAWHWLVYLPVTTGARVFFGNDIFRLFYPLRLELDRALAQARVPLWTPYLQAGFPLHAEGEIGAFYLPNIISVLLFPAHHALSYTILFHLTWATLGMYVLMRSAGSSVPSATLAAFVFSNGGFFVAHLQHAPHLSVAAWLPWLVWCQKKYWDSAHSPRWLMLAGWMLGMMLLAGFPPMAMLVVIAYSVFGLASGFLWRADASWHDARVWQHAAIITLVPGVLGALLAAVQLVPTLELMNFSIRGQDLGIQFFTSQSLDPRALTQLVLPFAQLGEPQALNMEFFGYLGILPFAFALLAPVLRRNRLACMLVVLGLVALVLALGDANPIYVWLYNVPVFNRFRVPARFIFIFTFTFAWLAAIGLDALRERLRDGRASTLATLAPGIVGAMAMLWFAPTIAPENWLAHWNALPIIFLALALVIFFAAWRRMLSRALFAGLVLGVTVCDLGLYAAPFLPLHRLTAPADVVAVPRNIRVMGNTQPSGRVIAGKFPTVSFNAVRAMLLPNFALQFEREGVAIYAPLAFQTSENFSGAMSLPMRNLMNARWYVLPLETAPVGEPSPFDETEPANGLTLELLASAPRFAPTRTTQIEIVSYTEGTRDLPDGHLVGELVLTFDDGRTQTLPLRLGAETADWTHAVAPVKHRAPSETQTFAAYLSAFGREFEGRKAVTRWTIAPANLVAIGVRSFLPGAGLTIERVMLSDTTGTRISLAQLLQRHDLALAFRSHIVALWENRDALPRAFVVPRAEFADDATALAQMQRADFQPAQVVWLNEANAKTFAANAPVNSHAEIVAYAPTSVTIRAATDAPGYLVLSDAWFPGWVATVNGVVAPIVRADVMFRAVALAPGEHTVVFEYQPLSFTLGASISALSWLGSVGAFIFLARRKSAA